MPFSWLKLFGNKARDEDFPGLHIRVEHSTDEEGNPLRLVYPPSKSRALRWLAALSAQNIPYRVEHRNELWIIVLGEQNANAALTEIRQYERINYDWPPRTRRASTSDISVDRGTALLTSLPVIGLMLLWFLWYQPTKQMPPWVVRGMADAEAIRNGEWWRSITALTLHADFGHVFGNAVSLFFFGYVVCRRIGAGTGWLAILLAGTCANLLNAWIANYPHVSLGASTAGFAALGIAALLQFRDKYVEQPDLRTIWHRAWVAAAAAVALLALLGTGAGTDISGHFLGFLSGVAAGTASLPLLRHNQNIPANAIAYGLFWITILGAWKLVTG